MVVRDCYQNVVLILLPFCLPQYQPHPKADSPVVARGLLIEPDYNALSSHPEKDQHELEADITLTGPAWGHCSPLGKSHASVGECNVLIGLSEIKRLNL